MPRKFVLLLSPDDEILGGKEDEAFFCYKLPGSPVRE